MNINAGSLHNEMQSMISKTNMSLSSLETGQVNKTNGADFSSMLKMAVDNVNAIQKNSANLQTAIEMGDRSVSISEVMIASQKANVAFTATVEVRNKFVEAYKEIMNMPV
ncbi:MAG: flagellar hook-basal body complex protein FliE [Gammaproteobacteria bacterium]|nr:flagellar hook-basal body complex protein FliE [Gammaproteobacteria bacterium]